MSQHRSVYKEVSEGHNQSLVWKADLVSLVESGISNDLVHNDHLTYS